MLKQLFNSIFWPLAALYLGYGLAESFLKGIISDAWEAPEVLLFAAVFFLVFRWLRAENTGRTTQQKTARPTVLREPLTSTSPVLQSRAHSHLRELLAQTKFERNQRIENAVIRAANQRNCHGPKACSSLQN